MIRSYIKIGWRNLLKNKAYSIINICGLSIGLASALAIGLFIADEYSYDKFHRHGRDIYRVVQQQNQAGELYDVASSPALMGKALRGDFPEVMNSCLVGYNRSGVLQHGEKTIESSAISMTDEGFLEMFDFKLLSGNPKKVFASPGQIVITDRLAVNLFGADWASNKELIGKTIVYNKTQHLMLVGVIQQPPTNSHIQFEAILSNDPNEDGYNNWFSNNYHTYLHLRHDADPQTLNSKLAGYIKKYMTADQRALIPPIFSLQPLHRIYLYSDFDFQTDWSTTSSIVYLRIFLSVGLIILVIAVFNFINLSTARAIRRAREVGIRKTIGAHYKQLMTQFLSEALLITTIAVIFALALVGFILPVLNDLASKSLFLPFGEIEFLVAIVLFTITVSILAGIYPSIYLSNFQPIKVLKGVFDVRSGRRFRQVLIVAQFTLTVVLISSAIVISQQLKFLREMNLGFDKSHLMFLHTGGLDNKKAALLRDDLLQHASIAAAALTSNSLIDVENSTYGFEWEGKAPDDKFLITRLNVDFHYLGATGIRLINGRNFNSTNSDSASFIINRTAARRMGWTEDNALGKSFTIWGKSGHIIGVVDDFHFRPMTIAINPLVLVCRTDGYYSGIMVKAGNVPDAIVAIEKTYKKYEDVTPAHYNFVDEQLDNQYRFEQRTAKLVLIFSGLAIFVACLGLYGLATFSAERRTKEIGIRKVMGASVAHVSMLLSKDFIFLVLLSIGIACPLGFSLMSSWLEGFVYRISLHWYFFLMAGGIALSIAALTVLYHAVTAARLNPVKSLKVE